MASDGLAAKRGTEGLAKRGQLRRGVRCALAGCSSCQGRDRIEQGLKAINILVLQGLTVELEEVVHGLLFHAGAGRGRRRQNVAVAAQLAAHQEIDQSESDQ